MASLLPYSSDSCPEWLRPIVAEIHEVVWDRVGLETVQEHVRRWANEYRVARDAYETDLQAFDKICDKNQATVENYLSLKLPSELRKTFLPPKTDLDSEPLPPEPPQLPLPPRHGETSLDEMWAGLAAIHDVFWRGPKINPWPEPPDNDPEAFSSWLKGEGRGFWNLMEEAARLLPNIINPIERWLKELTPAAKTEQGERKGGADAVGEKPALNSELDWATILAGLKPSDRKAYLAYQYAETMVGRRLQDREAYDWLEENGIDTSRGDVGELADYELPAFDTWAKQLRNARKPLGEQKYTRRGGRAAGKSIVAGKDVEYQRGSDE